MNLMPDLFSFAYVPSWYAQLEELAKLAIPEPWRFRNPNYYTKNKDTPILERYIHSVFRKQAIDYNEEHSPEKRRSISMWKMNTPASIPAFTRGGTKPFMPALTATSGRPVCWTGTSGDFRMRYRRG